MLYLVSFYELFEIFGNEVTSIVCKNGFGPWICFGPFGKDCIAYRSMRGLPEGSDSSEAGTAFRYD